MTLESWAKSESAICNFAKHILKKRYIDSTNQSYKWAI